MCHKRYEAEEQACRNQVGGGTKACWNAVDAKLDKCFEEICNGTGTQVNECLLHYESCFGEPNPGDSGDDRPITP